MHDEYWRKMQIQSTAERLIHEIQCQVKDAERDLEMRHASVNSRTADVSVPIDISVLISLGPGGHEEP